MKTAPAHKPLAALGMASSSAFLPWTFDTAPVCLGLLVVGFLAISATADWLRGQQA